MKTAMSEMLMVKTVKPISCAPFHRRVEGGHALLNIAGDVLHDHDGVVDHEAGGDGQGHERKVIQAIAEQIHHREGADQRNRHGDAGNHRGARAAQKNKNDQDHQQNGNHERKLDVLERREDGGGAVENNGHVDPLRDDGLEKWQLRADPIVGLDNVGAGLAEDMNGDRGIVVEIARIADVGGGVGDLGDIG